MCCNALAIMVITRKCELFSTAYKRRGSPQAGNSPGYQYRWVVMGILRMTERAQTAKIADVGLSKLMKPTLATITDSYYMAG